MAEETAVAAPSAAPESPKFTQFDGWDSEGNPTLSKPPKAAPAPADKPKEATPDDAPDSAGKKTQEQQRNKRRPDVEERFKSLTDENKKLKAELEEARRPKETKAEPSPAKPAEPRNYGDWRKAFKPTEWTAKYIEEHKDATWEDAQAALADHMADKREEFRTLEQQTNQRLQTVGQKLAEARTRYQDFDSVAAPVIQDLLKPGVSPQVFDILNDSPVLADVLYVIGGTEKSRTDFLEAAKSNPSKAARIALLIEQEVVAELKKGKTAIEKAETKEDAPVIPKPRAPKPPSEVGGRGAVQEDSLISAAKAGDFRSFEAEQTRRALASRR